MVMAKPRLIDPQVLKNLSVLKPANRAFVLGMLGLMQPVEPTEDARDEEPSVAPGRWKAASPEVMRTLSVLKPANLEYVLRRLKLVRPPARMEDGGPVTDNDAGPLSTSPDVAAGVAAPPYGARGSGAYALPSLPGPPLLQAATPPPSQTPIPLTTGRAPNSDLSPYRPEYFVVHQTAGRDPMKESRINENVGHHGLAHAYIMPSGKLVSITPFDWPEWATEQERDHSGLIGKMLHVELNYGSGASPTDAQYETLADTFIGLQKRYPGLAIVPHKEVDRGISGAHNDPENFDFARFYRLLQAKGAAPFDGIDPKRAVNANQADQLTSWPPVLHGDVQKKRK
jgi:N-acetylmuramoyl-L-alanine amidase